MTFRPSKKISFTFKLTLTLGLTAYLVRSIGFERFAATVAQGDLVHFATACAFVPVFILIKVLKWHMIARGAGATESFTTSLFAVLAGLGFGVFTPGRAGELMRVSYYTSVEKVMLGGLVVADRVIDLATILVLCLHFAVVRLDPAWTVIVALSAVAITGFLLQIGKVLKILSILPPEWRNRKLCGFVEKLASSSCALTPENLLRFAALSFVNWLVIIVQFYLLVNMFHACTFKTAFTSLPVIQLSNLIPVTIAGIGVRENVSVFVLKAFYVPEQAAVLGAFGLYVINIAAPGMAGLALFSIQGSTRKSGRMKASEKQAAADLPGMGKGEKAYRL